jgi:hypothetical protein
MTTTIAARGEITRQMLRGGRRALIGWAAAFAALVALYAVIWPSIRATTAGRNCSTPSRRPTGRSSPPEASSI